jgi:DNA-binding CsgD family transcriptional regulator
MERYMDSNTENSSFIKMAQSLSLMTSAVVYLWDNVNNRFLFLTGNSDLLGGMKAKTIMQTGHEQLIDMVPEDDRRLLQNVKTSLENNYHRIPKELRAEVVLYLNYHVGNGGRRMLINNRLSCVDFDADGSPKIILGLATPSVHRSERYVFFKIKSTDTFLHFNLTSLQWEDTNRIRITADERRMLYLSKSGFSAKDIAEIMNKSKDTVNFYRKSVYDKLEVKSITEAVEHAEHYGLI